jgi:peptidyl-prolyl cis-trans isomerase C
MNTFRRSALILLSVTAASACTRDQAPADASETTLGPGRVATVNGEPIPESLFRVYALNAARKDPDQLTPDEREAVIEDLLRFKLLESEARERGLLNERTIAAELEMQRLNLVARAMALRYIELNPATDAELQKVYDENVERLAPTEYKARHILVETPEEANTVIGQLNQGSDFVALAQERTTGPTGPNGGDLGWFSAASMSQPIVQAVATMNVGSYSSEPVQSEFGYHVLLLEDTRKSEPPTLDAVRDELKSVVDRQKLDEFVGSLRSSAVVETFETQR